MHPEAPSSGSAPANLSEPGPWTLRIASGLALAQLCWALFQWQQLVELRAGGEIFCGLSSAGGCADLWDSAFARTVRDWTLLPVAAWGVVWGISALALPVLAAAFRSAGRGLEQVWSGTVLMALAGGAGVVVLIAASAAEGIVCTNCALTYLLVGGYAVVCVRSALRRGPLRIGSAAPTALALVAVGYLAVLLPATQTPRAQPTSWIQADASTPVGLGAPNELDEPLDRLIAALPPRARQSLSNALEQYRQAPRIPPRPARGLIGSPTARVQLTEFADILCVHCADLHKQLSLLRSALPEGTLGIEPRYFPLDGRCNPMLQPAEGPPTRCVAAKALICAAEHPDAFELSGQLFARRTSLDPEAVLEIASDYVPRDELEACVESDSTQAKLQEDIQWAAAHGIQGTPLVLLDDRALPGGGPLLDALLLAGGDPDHPAFQSLPPPTLSPGS